MTVPSDVSKSGPYFGNGVTTAFNYDFKVVDETHLSVVVRDTVSGTQRTLVLNSDYTVTGVGNSGGGQIITTTAPTSNETLTILRNVPFTQDIDLENQGAYYAETVEDAFDLAVMRDQQLQEQLDRAVKLPVEADPSTLPGLVRDLIRVAASADEVDVVANNIADVVDVANNMPDVNTVAGIAEEISEIADEVNKAAGSAAASAAESKQWSEVSEQWATEAQQHVQSVTPSVVRFSGDGVSTQFDTGIAVIDELMTNVYVTGVYQQKNTYSVVDGIITFDSPPAAGIDNIEVMIGGNVSQAFAIPSNQTVTPAKTTWVFETVSDFKAAHVPPTAWGVEILGYYDAMDGGGARYKRVFAEPSHPGKLQSADGAWWELERGQQIRVEMFGAITGLNKANTTANDAAFANADAFMAAMGGGTVYVPGQFYCLTKLRWSPGVYFEGSGHGKWMPSFPTQPKTWEGTNLIGVASSKDYQVRGITSMKYAGGWREDPDTPGRFFKLTSFMNEDATGTTPATPRDMQVFAANKELDKDKGGLRRMRLVPWIGDDGISGYSDPGDMSLGDDLDIGLMVNSIDGARFEEVQIRGYWRVAGVAEICPDFDVWGRSENNVFINVSSQGYVGWMIRSGDRWRVLSSTANSLTIRWSEESYWPSSGQFDTNNQGIVTYTGITRAGNNLTFTGTSKDVSGTTEIRSPRRGTGFSTGRAIGCEAWALWHHSGLKAEDLGFPAPSKGTEISGYPMRGLHWFDYSSFGESSDSCNFFIHDCYDAEFIGGKWEIGRAIASPRAALGASTAEAPCGETRNLRLNVHWSGTIDTRMFTPRSVSDLQRQFNPLADINPNLLIKALPGQAVLIQKAGGQTFDVIDDVGAVQFRVTAAGNAIINGSVIVNGTNNRSYISTYTNEHSLELRTGTTTRLDMRADGTVAPGADNVQSLGSGGFRWSQVYAGTGTINTSDEREKQQIEAIPDEWLDAWGDVEWGRYKWNASVDIKGDGARWHVGLIAQRIRDAFAARGLDAFEIGLLCYDEWDEQAEISEPLFDADGNEVGRTIIRPHRPAGNRYGIRYEEALALEAAWQRREAARLRSEMKQIWDGIGKMKSQMSG